VGPQSSVVPSQLKLRIGSDRGSLVRTSRVTGNLQLLRIVLDAQTSSRGAPYNDPGYEHGTALPRWDIATLN
jgi:hypothetical protein